MSIIIREAKTEDMKAVLQLIQELADFEKEPDEVEISIEELERDFSSKLFECLVAEDNGNIVGMALYYNRYSTWKGKTIHLEDLIVTKSHRKQGIGKLLLEQLIYKCKEEKLRRLEWNVLDWNTGAIAFYENVGANILKDWYLVQLDKNGIQNY